MAKRTTATSWEIIVKDESGAMINVNYICPYCGMATGELIQIGAYNLDKLDGSWETDQVCGICDKEIIIVCH